MVASAAFWSASFACKSLFLFLRVALDGFFSGESLLLVFVISVCSFFLYVAACFSNFGFMDLYRVAKAAISFSAAGLAVVPNINGSELIFLCVCIISTHVAVS